MTIRRETTFRRALLSLAALAGLALLLALAPDAAADGALELTVAAASEHGDNLAYQEEPLRWSFVVNNTGDAAVRFNLSLAVADTAGWTLDPSLPNGTELAANASLAGNVTIVPAADALPGRYDLTLTVEPRGGGASASASFAVEIPEPDLIIIDVSFSHMVVWATLYGENSQNVTIFATTINSGGNVDSNGRAVADVDVWFTVEGLTIGKIQYIPSLKHDEEATVKMTFKPTREGNLAVQILVDTWNNQDGNNSRDINIRESNEDNNGEVESLKVSRIGRCGLGAPGFSGNVKFIDNSSTVQGIRISLNASRQNDRDWIVEVIESVNHDVSKVNFSLVDTDGNQIVSGRLQNIYGYHPRSGKGIIFMDNDYNGKVSPGDRVAIYPGEDGSPLADLDSVDGFTLRLFTLHLAETDDGWADLPSPSLPVLFLTLALAALVPRRQRH